MDDLKKKVVQFIQSRMELQGKEAVLVAEHILEVHRQILSDEKPDRILHHIERFLQEFATDIQIIEQRSQQRSKQNSYAEKRKTQLDIFSTATDQP